MVDFKDFFNEKMNPIARRLLYLNIVSMTGWAFMNPIFAIYVLDNIEGATLTTVGICFFVYNIFKAIFQLWISSYLDRVKGEGDDFFALALGQFLVTAVPFSLIFIRTPIGLYWVFFLYAVGDSLGVPAWNSLFTRHINPKRISFEWALNSTGVNFGTAIAVLVGSILAKTLGFPLVFGLVGVAQFVGFVFIISLKNNFVKKSKESVDYYVGLRS